MEMKHKRTSIYTARGATARKISFIDGIEFELAKFDENLFDFYL
jgi:hypothetical protein